ncbi:putative homoserine acetyltransferase family protein [Diplodia seriata]|uniref:Putative homoserine acetyltransferase family protein n=1 Tax=Diplodia seriata TaxID=420778 RepID=A0A0G2E204_9PEZI|nr:putative homoserine acetyltransferase family protein [Diplodia seriata]
MAAQTMYFTNDPHPNANAGDPSSTSALALAYRTYGEPGRPAVMMPTCYSGKLDTTLTWLWSAEANGGLPPLLRDHFVVVCGLLGGSESSSPSNTPPALRGKHFPAVTYEDNVRLQHALCHSLGVTKLALYIGFSMGGQQAYHMATLYPDFVERIVVLCSSARTSSHNWCFLEGPRAALEESIDFCDGDYVDTPRRGLRAFARCYATWALSSTWFRQRKWEALGFTSLKEYLRVAWEERTMAWDAHDLLVLMRTWQRGDISQFNAEGKEDDLRGTLASIKAKVLLMPCRTDLYFPPEDSEEEVKHLKDGKLRVIESVWGHLAGGGGGAKEDNAFIQSNVERLLAT